MIKIDHISFSYGEENENTGGVRDIDLNIEDGQLDVYKRQIIRRVIR